MMFLKGHRQKRRRKTVQTAQYLPTDIEFDVCHDLLRSRFVNDVYRILLACSQGATKSGKFAGPDGLTHYFAELASQEFILARDIVSGSVVGFLAYRPDFRPGVLRDIIFEHEPLKYLFVSAVAVAPQYRRLGLMGSLYDVLGRQHITENRVLIARAWESNAQHTGFLKKRGFQLAVTDGDSGREGEILQFFTKTILA